MHVREWVGMHVRIHVYTYAYACIHIYTAQRGGSRNNMRRWWRLGKVVCMRIDHKYAFVLACMYVCL